MKMNNTKSLTPLENETRSDYIARLAPELTPHLFQECSHVEADIETLIDFYQSPESRNKYTKETLHLSKHPSFSNPSEVITVHHLACTQQRIENIGTKKEQLQQHKEKSQEQLNEAQEQLKALTDKLATLLIEDQQIEIQKNDKNQQTLLKKQAFLQNQISASETALTMLEDQKKPLITTRFYIFQILIEEITKTIIQIADNQIKEGKNLLSVVVDLTTGQNHTSKKHDTTTRDYSRKLALERIPSSVYSSLGNTDKHFPKEVPYGELLKIVLRAFCGSQTTKEPPLQPKIS